MSGGSRAGGGGDAERGNAAGGTGPGPAGGAGGEAGGWVGGAGGRRGAGVRVGGGVGVRAGGLGSPRRKPRRYVERAASSGPVQVPQATVVFTVKLPVALAARMRAYAAASGR